MGPVHREILHPGQGWSRVLRRHQRLRLVDTEGRACVAALLFNALQPIERYNMPDTLKAQFTAYLTAGRVLFSDMGRVLASITADSAGWHDTITGHEDAAESAARYGHGTYQELRNGFHRNTRDNFLVELAKHGLGERDLHANVNFFAKVVADADGRLRFVAGASQPGDRVELRAEIDVLVVLSNTPHPLSPAVAYAPPGVSLEIELGEPPAADDPCRIGRAETARGFALTEALFA